MRLKRIDKATEELPDEYFLSALRTILTGRIKEEVDVKCSEKEEPKWRDVLTVVRKYANIQRLELSNRKRNDMQLDQVNTGKDENETPPDTTWKPEWTPQGK